MANKDSIQKIEPYNPLNKRNLGGNVTEAVLASPVYKLPPSPFIGAGVYLLYYTGTFDPYSMLARANSNGRFSVPIYVGKAVPAGARKGGLGLDIEPGQVLQRRLCEHAESINAANNLDLNDFHCRYLVVDDIWIPLAESLLIEMFKPIWNQILDGFGNHDPGKGRYKQQKSSWDCLHPGRVWADRLQPCAYSKDQLIKRVTLSLGEDSNNLRME